MSLLGNRHMLLSMLNTSENVFSDGMLARIEGHASVMGLTHICRFIELKDELVKYCKAVKELEEHPFEPATLDNAHEAYYDLGTSLQVFTSQCDSDFDARDVVDFEKLREVIDDMFRCAASLRNPFDCEPLQVLARSVTCLVYQLSIVMRKDADRNVSLHLSSIIKECDDKESDNSNVLPPVTFTVLDKQKYFNEDERAEMRVAEARKRENELKLKEAKEFAEKSKMALNIIRKYCFNDDGDAMYKCLLSTGDTTNQLIVDAAYALQNAIFTEEQFVGFCNAKFSTLGDMEFQLKRDLEADKLRAAMKFMSLVSGNDITIKSLDTGIDYSDASNTDPLKKDEWIIMISHK